MTSPFEPSEGELPAIVRGSWHRFLDTYEPLRPELYRYCRHLTRSPWDAEDLAQDALTRAFVTLGQMGEPPANPRAWLFRVASNLWIDEVRRRRPEGLAEGPVVTTAATDPRATREVAGSLIGQLSPQERAAVVLKDVFELSLEEVAEALSSTPGSIKTSLHRAREKLAESAEPRELPVPAPGVLNAFCQAFNAADLGTLAALLLDAATVEVVGATTQYGPEAAKRTVLFGMLFGSKRMAAADTLGGMGAQFIQGVRPTAPRIEARQHRGEWLFIHWYEHEDGQFVRAVTRVATAGGGEGVSRLRNYFFNPDFIAEVCQELDVPFRSNGYQWWLTGSCNVPNI